MISQQCPLCHPNPENFRDVEAETGFLLGVTGEKMKRWQKILMPEMFYNDTTMTIYLSLLGDDPAVFSKFPSDPVFACDVEYYAVRILKAYYMRSVQKMLQDAAIGLNNDYGSNVSGYETALKLHKQFNDFFGKAK